ncbi:MAG: ABC transporter permease, partial [Bacteroidia bacterium]|nr:ABC transporter permease [Bacteroidia bacterium]
MFRNYFKAAVLQMRRNPLSSFINLLGLSVGIASCIIIFLFVFNEFKYDRFHKNDDRIYRAITKETSDGVTRQFAHSNMPLLPLMKTQMEEIEEAVRLLPQSV